MRKREVDITWCGRRMVAVQIDAPPILFSFRIFYGRRMFRFDVSLVFNATVDNEEDGLEKRK
jgi:hypothetical protein